MLALAPAAQASWQQAIRDCANDGRLHQHYSQSDLEQALRHLPPDIAEYTDCSSVLKAALAGPGGSGGSGGGAGGGPAIPTPAETNAIHGVTSGRPPRLSIAGHQVTPGTGGVFHLASETAQNKLPQPLLWSLIALATMFALAGAVALRHRLPGMRRVALRVFRR